MWHIICHIILKPASTPWLSSSYNPAMLNFEICVRLEGRDSRWGWSRDAFSLESDTFEFGLDWRIFFVSTFPGVFAWDPEPFKHLRSLSFRRTRLIRESKSVFNKFNSDLINSLILSHEKPKPRLTTKNPILTTAVTSFSRIKGPRFYFKPSRNYSI